MPLVVLVLELLCGFIEFDLCRLCQGDLFLELLLLPPDFDGELLDLEVELPYFSVIFLFVLLQSYVVFLLLLPGDRPLLELFLIPVELQFDLFHLFIDPENSYLNIVESFLIF